MANPQNLKPLTTKKAREFRTFGDSANRRYAWRVYGEDDTWDESVQVSFLSLLQDETIRAFPVYSNPYTEPYLKNYKRQEEYETDYKVWKRTEDKTMPKRFYVCIKDKE